MGCISSRRGSRSCPCFGWGYATISLRTKKIKGLHENDFIMAVSPDSNARIGVRTPRRMTIVRTVRSHRNLEFWSPLSLKLSSAVHRNRLHLFRHPDETLRQNS